MASFLLSNLSHLSHISLSPTPYPLSKSSNQIRCGPRSNRGPLLKGRTLSSEAIQAVQSLKRSHRLSNGPNPLSRLIKSDLIAAFKELLRQDLLDLALIAFSVVRSEYDADLTAYADIVSALDRGKRPHDIDRLIVELESERRGCLSGLSLPGSLPVDADGSVIGSNTRLSPPGFFSMHTDGSVTDPNPRLSLPSSFYVDDTCGNDSNTRLSPPSSFSIHTDESVIDPNTRLSLSSSFSMDDTDGNDSNIRLSPPSFFHKGSNSRLSRPDSFVDNDKDRKEGGIGFGDSKGLLKLVKTLIAAGRGESTVRVYEMMKRSGWGSDRTVEDEYLGRVLERGFKRFGEDRLAKEVRDLCKGLLEKELV